MIEQQANHLMSNYAFALGLFIVILIVLIANYIIGIWQIGYNFADLVRNDAGYPTLSKLQFLAWTLVIIFSYITIYLFRILNNIYAVMALPSPNILILMGISIATPLASGAIGGMKYSSMKKKEKKDSTDENGDETEESEDSLHHQFILKLKKKVQKDKRTKKWSLMLMSRFSPSLSRFQMFAWTVVSIVIYMSSVIYMVFKEPLIGNVILPDIDSTLVALMGLSQGAYIGNKLLTSADLEIAEIKPGTGKPGSEVVLLGFDFTEQVGMVFFDNKIVDSAKISEWSQTTIRFKVPQDAIKGDNKSVQIKANARLSNIVTYYVENTNSENNNG